MNFNLYIFLLLTSILTLSYTKAEDKFGLRTPHGIYQQMYEYKMLDNKQVSRVLCRYDYGRSLHYCDQLYETVGSDRLAKGLFDRKISAATVKELFAIIQASKLETIRVSDLERSEELRLAAGLLDVAFINAGKGLHPYTLNHRYVDYIEMYRPSVTFDLIQKLRHPSTEPTLYTYNFFIQDGVVNYSIENIDRLRNVCRLSSVVPSIEAGKWILNMDTTINSLRLVFNQGTNTLYLSCGKLKDQVSGSRGYETDSSATLSEIKSILGTLIDQFKVIR